MPTLFTTYLVDTIIQCVKRSRFFRVPLPLPLLGKKRSATPTSLLLKKRSGTPSSLFHVKSALFYRSYQKQTKKTVKLSENLQFREFFVKSSDNSTLMLFLTELLLGLTAAY